MTNYILIDLSYFIFYRYFALIQWWKMAKQEARSTPESSGSADVRQGTAGTGRKEEAGRWWRRREEERRGSCVRSLMMCNLRLAPSPAAS